MFRWTKKELKELEELRGKLQNGDVEHATQDVETNNRTIAEIAADLGIRKIDIDGMMHDIRAYDKNPFKAVPIHASVMKKTIYNEPVLFCCTH